MKPKRLIIVKRVFFMALWSLVYVGLGFGIAVLISSRSKYNLQDAMSMEGLILVIVGILMSMKGNPSGADISRAGQKDFLNTSYYNFEITRQERENKPFHKEFLNNNIVEFAFGRLTLIFGGISLLVASVVFF